MNFDDYSTFPPEEKSDKVYRTNFIDNNNWTEWPEDLHNDLAQVKSQDKAFARRTDPDKIDKHNQSGIFSGSGKNPYTVNLSSCTCGDFIKKKKPCKHMYRLAHELGVIELCIAEAAYRNIIIMRSIQNCKNFKPQWGGWDKRIHKVSSQKDRIYRAISGNYSRGYQTTFENCSCPDFQERKFPCKHIYALRFKQKGDVEGLTTDDLPKEYASDNERENYNHDFGDAKFDDYGIQITTDTIGKLDMNEEIVSKQLQKLQSNQQSRGCVVSIFFIAILAISYMLN